MVDGKKKYFNDSSVFNVFGNTARKSVQESSTDIPVSEEERKKMVERSRTPQLLQGLEKTIEGFTSPGEQMKEGVDQLADNPLAGATKIGLSIVNTALTATGIPTMFSVLSDASRKIGLTEVADTFDGIMNLPNQAVDAGTKGIEKGLEFLGYDRQAQIESVKKISQIALSTGKPEAQVFAPFLTEEGQQEFSSALDEVNKLTATIGSFHSLNLGAKKLKGETVKPIDVREYKPSSEEIAQRKSEIQTKADTKQLQRLYSERSKRIEQADKSTNPKNKQFFEKLINKLDDKIKPLEEKFGATSIEQPGAVKGLTQEKLPYELFKDKQDPADIPMISLRDEVTKRNLIPDADKQTADLPKLGPKQEVVKPIKAPKPKVEPPSETPIVESKPEIKIAKTYDAFKQNKAPKTDYIDNQGRERTTYTDEAYKDFMDKSDETGQKIRWGVELNDGRKVSFDGAIRITKPDVWNKIDKIKGNRSDKLWKVLTKDEQTQAVNDITTKAKHDVELQQELKKEQHPFADVYEFRKKILDKNESSQPTALPLKTDTPVVSEKVVETKVEKPVTTDKGQLEKQPNRLEKTAEFNDRVEEPEAFKMKEGVGDYNKERAFVGSNIDNLLTEFSKYDPKSNANLRLGRDVEFKIGDFKAKLENPTYGTLSELKANTNKTAEGLLNQGLREQRGTYGRAVPERSVNPRGKIDIDAVNQAKVNIISKTLGRTNMGFDPTIIKDYAVVGAYHFENLVKAGIEKGQHFAEFSKRMIQDFGESIKKHLGKIWLDVKTEFAKQIMDYAGKKGLINYAVESKKIINENADIKFKTESPETRKAVENKIDESVKGIRALFDKDIQKKNVTEKDFDTAIKQVSFRTLPDEIRYRTLEEKYTKELNGGKKLTTDEKIELDNLRPAIDLESNLRDNFRIKPDVVNENPLIKASYQELFERSRTAEMEAIDLKKEFSELVSKSRKSTKGGLYKDDTNVLKFLAGEKVNLTIEEQALAKRLDEFRTDAKRYKTSAQLRENYDFPLKRRGFVEAWHYDGLHQAIKEKLKKTDPREVERIERSMNKDEMFDIYSLQRIGRTEHPTMDLDARLENYIDVYTIQKNVQPILPTINKLNQAMKNAGLTNNVKWNQDYVKEILGEKFKLGIHGEEALNQTLSTLNTVAAIRFLWYNKTGGLGNLVGGLYQNLVSGELSGKEFATGLGRVLTPTGQRLLTKRGVVDASTIEKSMGAHTVVKELVSPYIPYTAGERVIQGSFYLGKLTPKELRDGFVNAAKDRQILESKARAQGGYHKGLRPDIVRTGLGRAAMKFRLWAPAVLESKVQKVFSTGRLIESLAKKENLTSKDKSNLNGLMKEVVSVGSAIYLLNELPDDTKRKLEDALGATYGFMSAQSLQFQLTNLIPAVQSVAGIVGVLGAIGQTYEKDSDYGKAGSSKAVGKLKQLAPSVIKPLFKRKTFTGGTQPQTFDPNKGYDFNFDINFN